MPIGLAFKVVVQVVPPMKPLDFSCPLGRIARCLPKIVEITPKGVMLIKFPLGLSSFNQTEYHNISQALLLDLADPDQDSGGSNAALSSWEVTSMSEDSITMLLNFEQSLYLSARNVIAPSLIS